MADMTDATTTPTDKAGEPVAWRIRPKGALGDVMGFQIVTNAYTAKDYSDQPAFEVQPLYTHPQTSLSVGLDVQAIAKDAAERVHKNSGCVPQLAYAPILWALQDALALSAPAGGWQPIETAPKDATEVLVLLAPKVIRLGWYFKRSSRTEGWCDENGKSIKPTHWMPLPAAPTGGRS